MFTKTCTEAQKKRKCHACCVRRKTQGTDRAYLLVCSMEFFSSHTQ